ncbi:2-polyprenyl-6-methoxyphenol hydroxylase-like FAD-dependent oxidoreductase [Actinomycetospora succinea]|uniref:2-polyprenyl-6-methoxyphenol hydroxylase-like FAD-dependent oxidoreductase n=1 Tax=Actinomycetospora succinea TaxID=663603 RepID=A0A4R6UPS5_9PSEU|nr:FAD-dependent monooxygenase [Actinomycetospora succinea]TDQ48902.1 2-polyprenyl-6-methoxyphenol hydroxylase-like FAD-dependent oxidoreductase [Actinomycetospora succinea]
MKITCIGGGPAGLYSAVLLAQQGHEVTVAERNPAGTTHGWGVVFWDPLLASLRESDPTSAQQIADAAFVWDGQDVDVEGRGRIARPSGGYSISRQRLLDILTARAQELGVRTEFEREIAPGDEGPGDLTADLVIAADGVGSAHRRAHADEFAPTVDVGTNKYVWLATTKVYRSFLFAFVRSSAGWLWCHAYGYDDDHSTFIVECSPETWRGLGLDRLGAEESREVLERLFARHLDGHPLIGLPGNPDEPLPWLEFRTLRCEQWWSGRTVLAGDAAHTTHFAIGSGTTLALADAIALGRAVGEEPDLEAALKRYQADRQAALVPSQRDARNSARWLEDLERYIDTDVESFATLLHRRCSSLLAHLPPTVYVKAREVAERSGAARRVWSHASALRRSALVRRGG